MVRFLEVEIVVAGVARQVLLPMNLAKIDGGGGRVLVDSILAHQFAGVPPLASPDRISSREEDRIGAYYAGGSLYAEPSRLGPLL
jgi:photosynthetic reaction center H subunit